MEITEQTSYKDGSQKTQHEKWNYIENDDTTCECKEEDQTMDHLLECPLFQKIYSSADFIVYNNKANDCVK